MGDHSCRRGFFPLRFLARRPAQLGGELVLGSLFDPSIWFELSGVHFSPAARPQITFTTQRTPNDLGQGGFVAAALLADPPARYLAAPSPASDRRLRRRFQLAYSSSLTLKRWISCAAAAHHVPASSLAITARLAAALRSTKFACANFRLLYST